MQTVAELKQELRANWEKGIDCPGCGQFVKLYRRKLPYAAIIGLIAIYNAPKDEEGYAFFPDLQDKLHGTAAQGGYGTLSHFWGLIESKPERRDDNSNRIGWWRVTPLGSQFLNGEVTVPSHALIFNGKCYGLEGEQITAEKALGNKFDFIELMRGL